IAQSFTILENAIIQAVGQFSDATGAAGGFSAIIIDLARFIESDFTPGLLKFGDILGVTFAEAGRVSEDLGDQFDIMGPRVTRSFEDAGIDIVDILQTLGLDAVTESGFISNALLEIPINMVRAFEIATTEIGGAFLNVTNEAELFANAVKGIFATITGDEEGENAAIQERLELLSDEREIASALQDQRIAIGDQIIKQESAIAAAIEERRKERALSNKADLDEKAGIEAGVIASPQQLKDAAKLIKSLETPLEEFQRNIAEINALQKAGGTFYGSI
ncbi:unnamed protein product, partial [marine sediment metagenome]